MQKEIKQMSRVVLRNKINFQSHSLTTPIKNAKQEQMCNVLKMPSHHFLHQYNKRMYDKSEGRLFLLRKLWCENVSSLVFSPGITFTE